MSEENANTTTALTQPNTTHSYEERRAVTDDVLKLSKHELKKEFQRRVEEAEDKKQELYDALGDLMAEYNDAMEVIWLDTIPDLEISVQRSFNTINNLESAGDEDKVFTVKVVPEDQCMLFGLASMKSKGYYYLGASHLSELCEQVSKHADGAAMPAKVHMHIKVHLGDVKDDYVVMSSYRIASVEPSYDLIAARTALVERAGVYFEAVEEYEQAEKDLHELPKKIEDIEMQATAQRVQDAGGAGVLDALLQSVESIKEGRDIQALPNKGE